MLVLSLCAVIFLGFNDVQAKGGPGKGCPPEGGQGKHGRGERFKGKFDTNGDGQLDDAEKAKMKESFKARREEKFNEADTNGDGQLSKEEFLGMKPKKHNR